MRMGKPWEWAAVATGFVAASVITPIWTVLVGFDKAHEKAIKFTGAMGRTSALMHNQINTLYQRVQVTRTAWELGGGSTAEHLLVVRSIVNVMLEKHGHYKDIANEGPIEAQFRKAYGISPSQAHLDDNGKVVVPS